MKQIQRILSIVLTTIMLISICAFANASGSTQMALANQKLSLRSGPSTKTDDLGTYQVQGQYVELSAKSWDSVNSIWWVKCSFSYNGSRITGWTGAKRFDISTYSLNKLPETASSSSGQPAQPYSGYGSSRMALANQKLALRSGPSTNTSYVGTYPVEGQYIELSAKSWDSVNSIWWVKCGFSYNGSWVTGWTGAKRFDSSTYSLNKLPETSASSGGRSAQSRSSIVNSLMDDVNFYDYYPNFEPCGSPAVGSHVNEDGTWTWGVFFSTCPGMYLRVINCNEYVSLRAEASTSSERLAKVPYGANVWCMGYLPVWALCEYNGRYGWILTDYLSY